MSLETQPQKTGVPVKAPFAVTGSLVEKLLSHHSNQFRARSEVIARP